MDVLASENKKVSAFLEKLENKFPHLDISDHIADVKFLEEKTSIKTEQKIDNLLKKFVEILVKLKDQYHELLEKESQRQKNIENDLILAWNIFL